MITIFGDSHVSSMSWVKTEALDLDIRFVGTHGLNWAKFDLDETPSGIRVKSDRVPNQRPVDLEIVKGERYYFSSMLHTAPFFRSPVWRKYCPWRCSEMYPEMIPVSDSVIRTWVDSEMHDRINLIEYLAENDIEVGIIESPKPLMRVPLKTKLKPEVVLEVDRLVRDYMFKKFRRLGISVIKAPKETINGGFTKEEFSHANPKDGHHGNKKYYAMMLGEIVKDSAKRAELRQS